MGRDQKDDLIVRALSRRAVRGIVRIGLLSFPCALGRSGLGNLKREGDGLTPIGRWPIRKICYRADRRTPLLRPRVPAWLNLQAIGRQDGWCDAVGDTNYNRAVHHPYHSSAEELWRADNLYDVIVVLGHNDRPRIQGGGSAIFMHVANVNADGTLQPTAGCVALRARDLRTILSFIRPSTHLRVV